MSEGSGKASPAPGIPAKEDSESKRAKAGWRAWAGFGGFLVAFVWFYFFIGTHLIHQTNQDRLNWDQQHNMVMSLRGLEREQQPIGQGESVTAALWRSFPHYTDGVVNPLWPWVASRFATEDHEAFFIRGKWFNLTMTAVFLVLMGLAAARAFSISSAIALLLAAGFGAILPRATYFQPEPLYYLLFFLSWVCALSLLRRNSLWMYGTLGFLLGLTYLAKTSIQPFLLVFVGVTTLRAVAEWWRLRKRPMVTSAEDERWSLPNHFIGLAVLAMTFLASAGPRLSYANDAFGSPFHSYPGYWMWMDDFTEGADFMHRYPNAEAFAEMTPEEKPSAMNYLRSHPREEVIERMRQGVTKKLSEFFSPKEWRKSGRELLPFRGWLLGAFYLMLAAMTVFRIKALKERDRESWIWPLAPESGRWMLLFALGVFAVSTAAFGFYEPIGKGDRFLLALYLPMAVTPVWIAERFRRQIRGTHLARPANLVFFGLNALVAVAVLIRMLQLLVDPVFQRGLS
ncbi:MAG: hypothetical protein KDN19_13840 [Verrucomicrobiae bacterium]|nr:hypothetical protein [Verrucomicrobiae bacterium]